MLVAYSLLVLITGIAGDPPPPGTPPVVDQPGDPLEFHAGFSSGIERCWIGPDYWANRLQDWRLVDGRLECVEGAAPVLGRDGVHGREAERVELGDPVRVLGHVDLVHGDHQRSIRAPQGRCDRLILGQQSRLAVDYE